MKKLVKTAGAAALIMAPASAHAMPDPVPSKWTSLMQRAWAIVADHRPCSNNIYRVCDGRL